MEFPPPNLARATVAVTALGMGAYFQRNRFRRSRVMIEHPIPGPKLSELPQEIILKIFKAVHDTPTPTRGRKGQEEWIDYDQGTRDIQNIRLTCRLFNNISSELLIKFVGVDLNMKSLGRLQNIMRHPTIGKGVRMVRIRLAAYDWYFHQCQELYADEMRDLLRRHRHGMDLEVMMFATRCYKGSQRPSRDAQKQFNAAVERAHREYVRRFLAQYCLPKGYFADGVASALRMSRWPLRMEITDSNDFAWSHRQSVYRATRANLLDLIMRPQPSTWQELEERVLYMPRNYAWMIAPMLASFADDRIHIADLNIDISHTSGIDQPRHLPAQGHSGGIQRVMQNLQKFTYRSESLPFMHGIPPEWRRVLFKCLPPNSLHELTLQRVELRPSTGRWANLTRINLIEVDFNFKQLALLLRPLKPHAVEIYIDECNLTGGLWADVLDLLRDKQRWTRVDWPYGMEIPRQMDTNEFNYVFVHLEDWHGGASKAEQYIRGWWDANPVRQHTIPWDSDSDSD